MTTGLEGDPGAQPQRTILSWHRTVLSITMGALVASLTAQRLGHSVLSGVAALAAILAMGGSLRRLRYWHPAQPRFSVIRQSTLAVVALAVIGMGLAIANILDRLFV